MTHERDSARVDGGDGPRPVTAAAVAELTGGRLVGNAAVIVHGIAPLDRATPHEVSLYSHARYAAWFARTQAGVVVMDATLEPDIAPTQAWVVVDKPVDAMVQLLSHFHRSHPRPSGVHPTAVVAPTARLGAEVCVEPFAVIGEHVVLGDRCWIGAHAVVQQHCTLGNDVRVYDAAVLYPGVDAGDRVVVHAGARVGRDGFGFVPTGDRVTRIPHVGRCILEADVEIGANSCIDRGSIDDTVIGAGTKIDNLVHVAHNVRIGRMCFLAAQVGVAGSARIEDGVQLGGQVGVAGHITIGARASLAGQAGVIGDVAAGEVWSGYPARPHKEQLRAHAALRRLVSIIRPLEHLLGRKDEP